MNFVNVALAPHNLEHELERELKYRKIKFKKKDRLFFLEKNYCPLFAQVTWINCQTISIESIGDGIKKLKKLGRNWALFSVENHRRAQLIQDGLYKIKDNVIDFLEPHPKYPMGGWTLLDADTIVCSVETTSRYPLGKCEFNENKDIPPSRAYLKLWEFFTIYRPEIAQGTQVIDMGSAPGGWTWVLAELGLKVISVDKADLDSKIKKLPHVNHLQESAFGLDPKSFPEVVWFFSDIICYPEKLLELIKKWIEQSNVKNFVCTIKFQGNADFKIIDAFSAIPKSKIVHLYHNKHEVTWWLNQETK